MATSATDDITNRAAHLMANENMPWEHALAQATEELAGSPRSDDEHSAAEKAGEVSPPRRTIAFARASQVRTEAVDWLLDCWIPRGSVTLLGGREGIGKSTIAVDWAAQATRGELTGTPMTVAYVVTEDSREHTVVPRLKAAGADLDKVLFLDALVPDPDRPEIRYEASLDLPGDYPILQRFIKEQSVGLVVLDAAKSVMSSKLKGNDDLDIRRFLEPMHKVAQATDCTFVCLVHFSAKKGSSDTGNLIMGSSAWQQVARSVVAVAEDKDNATVKVWNSKANLAPKIRTMEAQVVSAEITTDDGRHTDVGRINWLGECEEDGSALLAPDAERSDADDRTDAEVWLEDYLRQYQPCSRKDVLADAAKARVASEATIKRAFRSIGGVSEPKGFPRTAHWSLPSRLTVVPTGPVPLRRDPTEPTGADLHKRDDPTGGNSAVGARAGTEPTVPTDPVPLEGVPTVPTGHDLHKRNVPTVQPGQSGHSKNIGSPPATTPHLSAVPSIAEPADSLILGALDTEHGLSPSTVAGSVPGLTREDAPTRLEALATQGLVRADSKGRYTRNAPNGTEQ